MLPWYVGSTASHTFAKFRFAPGLFLSSQFKDTMNMAHKQWALDVAAFEDVPGYLTHLRRHSASALVQASLKKKTTGVPYLFLNPVSGGSAFDISIRVCIFQITQRDTHTPSPSLCLPPSLLTPSLTLSLSSHLFVFLSYLYFLHLTHTLFYISVTRSRSLSPSTFLRTRHLYNNFHTQICLFKKVMLN